jgi:hypothetical protein
MTLDRLEENLEEAEEESEEHSGEKRIWSFSTP